MVHDYPGLSAAMKLQYLKTNVHGEAEQLLRNFTVTDANYVDAWDTLVNRFDNPRILVQTHVRALHTLAFVGKESAAGIKRLLDATNESVRALRNLNQPVQHWDAFLVELVCHRLDPLTRRDWETSLGDARDFPTWAQLSAFLETRVRALEAARPSTSSSNQNQANSTSGQKTPKNAVSAHTASTNTAPTNTSTTTTSTESGRRKSRKCPLCSEQHYVGSCPQYKALEVTQRDEQSRRLRLCRNCLGFGHVVAACTSAKRCNTCGENHHSSLHGAERSPTTAAQTPASTLSTSSIATAPAASPTVAHHASSLISRSRSILLGTAQVSLSSKSGRHVLARVLIDPCSEGCFTTEAKVQALRAQRTPAIVPVSGVAGANVGVSKSLVTLDVSSLADPSMKISVVACVLPRVTSDLPSRVAASEGWTYISGLHLADPQFDTPGKIDMILGADVYQDLLMRGVRFGPPGTPLAQETIFGWILTGPASTAPLTPTVGKRGVSVHHCTTNNDLLELVRKFWELEEVSATQHLTEDEQNCETLFKETHRRESTGRYVVRLPFRKEPAGKLGDSRPFACRALVRGERRRENDNFLKAEYSKFLSEYLSLGHMAPVTVDAGTGACVPPYYMPHHAVVRETEGKTKIRVVFNASHPSSSGQSLNDLLSPGPKLQADITTILIRWRRHRIVFAADIVKMFRQIKVHTDDCDFQRIVWRESAADPIQDMKLLTVTYGTACAPYLAIRTLQQLAKDEAYRYPEAAKAIQCDTYVDDTLTGADDLIAARELVKTSLIQLLKSGGFELSKWTSNSADLLTDHADHTASDLPSRSFEPDEWVRTLGVVWRPSNDSFSVKLNLDQKEMTATKRTLLSELARTYDPLGWVALVLVRAKILFQDSWAAGIAWDEPLPAEMLSSWQELRSSLPELEDLAIPRWLGSSSHPRRYELHGFSDASERAYCAAVYARATAEDGVHTVSLLVAKTKVAPLKSVTLPRLELCGAVLLARLMSSIKSSLRDDINDETFAWSDSTVTLAWLRGHPSRWVPFVANRVSEVISLLPGTTWQHVRSQENPADLATRGIAPKQLLEAELWWQGPEWLRRPPSEWPHPATTITSTDIDARVERRAHTVCTTPKNATLERFSRLTRLLRITAWCLRLRQRTRDDFNAVPRVLRPLGASEIISARQRWITLTQNEAFPDAIDALRRKEALPSRSVLTRLNPFLDDTGVLGLGGRLQHAFLSYGERHPAILPGSAKFTELLIRQAHEVTLHGGPQLTMSYLLRFCWILGGRNRVRAIVHRCVECTRHRAAKPKQLMGQLPASRITPPSRPFERAGLDYAGPFLLRASSGRGRATFKAYIALFICLSTRAVHLEVVGSYSSESFIAAFKRFSARRGICAELHSDNGTNFTGADRELRSMFRAASAASKEIAATLANDGTTWHFIPPHAPHFGGIWEAGIKATKHHLRRVIGETILSYEEFATVVTQIEGCLNSRPISPLSSDPADLVALTPGHFLIGGAPTAPPEPSLTHLPVGRLGRWQLTTHMLESFWRRWSAEYLHHLQQRNKWKSKTRNIAVGDLVLIRDDLRPPAKWPLARVTEAHPGSDGLTRVVTVKTAASTYRRPIVKLVLLPIREHDEETVEEPDESVATVPAS